MEDVVGVRLDLLASIVEDMISSKDLESVLGSPVMAHVAMTVEDGQFKFRTLIPDGEEREPYTDEEVIRASEIVDQIVSDRLPGDLPEVK
ncbi:MAG: hypothetical protein GF416_03525 [Candidatus Altiarchaeales archaeon]|nr:hypothetical protein [Candidatus Altiarchaeales archaeon]MBD3416189.1 hypothetical protein [Candidatus Altiarchaeales archaeon]